MLPLVALGCSTTSYVSVRSKPNNPLTDELKLLSRSGPKPTERTVQLLRRYDLSDSQKGDPRKALAKLQEIIVAEPSADKLCSFAELAYIQGTKIEAKDPTGALDLYGASVAHAYLYLFDPRFGQYRNPYDPQFRGSCELYNSALESALRMIRKRGELKPGKEHTVESGSQTWDVKIVLRGGEWQAEDFERFEFVSDYNVTGLQNQYHNYGLGVPLIAVRKSRPRTDPTEQFYPPNLSFPVTAFLRLLPDDRAQTVGGKSHHRAELELYDPLVTGEIAVCNRQVPLEADLSTPLAYALSDPAFQKLDVSTLGLLHPEKAQALTGLYMLQPYQPDKIPVLMVHGLWSSPLTWMEMFNDLRSSPELRSKYQFWFYLYPSGQPFWLSGAQLREDLANMRTVVDPGRHSPALDQMVLVGHSMGGLVSKLQTLDSGEDFWHLLSEKPFADVKTDEETRRGLFKTVYFKPNISVRRVITIGTPHRGSDVANDTTRWLGRELISLPQKMVMGEKQLRRDNPDFFKKSTLIDVTTSIDSLSPQMPIFPVMLAAHHGSWVKYHNIVGRVDRHSTFGRIAGDGDGVVPYSSAHLEDVESELVVEADHTSLHQCSRSVLEVRRILMEYSAELDHHMRIGNPAVFNAPPAAIYPARPAAYAAPQPAGNTQVAPLQ